jgi:tRNA-dihydrouridine synthase 3
VGLLEVLPQQLHWRPPAYRGRNQLETLLGSDNPADWVRISEMLLGRAPPGFVFSPKHKTNAYVLTAEQVAATYTEGAGMLSVPAAQQEEEDPVEG